MSGRRKVLIADLLCGAGGSTTGAERALLELGFALEEIEFVCVNHWPTAIKTHSINHPKARHYVQDIATVRPHLLVPEGYLDLLMASPTCTHHSVARGGKPTSDQQRSDPWHIITWLTELRVKRLIIENVWEFMGWGPVDVRTGRPVKSRKGEYFMAWIDTIRRLGFEPEWRRLNAADYGDATTRQRFILKARSDRKLLGWAPRTHARRSDGNVLQFTDVQPWKAAREIIDWTIKGRSIYGRKKPLAPKTLNRIYAGIVKYGWPEGYIVTLRNHMAAQGLDVPLPTIAASGQHLGLVQLVGGNRTNNTMKPVTDPLGGFTTTTGGGLLIAEPLVLSQHNSGAARSADEPLPTITTGGAAADGHPGCARPMLVTVAHGNDDATSDRRRSHSIEDPLGTVSAGGVQTALVEPFVLAQASGGAPRGVDEPIPTQTAGGHGAAHALIAPYYGSGSGETCKSTDDPLDTITARERFGMVMAITHADGSDRARDVADPLPTLTTAHRGELAFITAQHGEREGQAPRTHPIGQPLPTIAATGHVDMAEPAPQYDILFRMLEPHELAAAMGFNDDDQEYEFAGTKTDKIKQIGNAVSVSMMKAEVRAIMADIAPTVRASRERAVA